jgi:3-methyl-2-oxobutanoate hydroxymethyltransferase
LSVSPLPNGGERVDIRLLHSMKEKGEKVALLTAYDHPFALIEDCCGIDVILVGDSLGMTVLGHETTLPVTMDIMLEHTGAVVRATKRAMVIADMPFLSFQTSARDAVANAGAFLKKAGAHGVKIEGGVRVREAARAIVDAGVPLLGHVGLTPQSIQQFGRFGVQGKDAVRAARIVDDARALVEAGAFAIIAECIPAQVTKILLEEIPVPIYGIGAGECDGQILVIHDLVGLFEQFLPKFAKKYADVSGVVKEAVRQYVNDVKEGAFPAPEHQYRIKPEELERLRAILKS